MPINPTDLPKTRIEGIAKAWSWLDKAVVMEAEGKSASLVNRALDRACEFENYAFTLPAMH